MNREFDVVIVGAGHGGAQAAAALRQEGFSGSIALIGDEPDLPYERPALSKEYFSGEKLLEQLLIHPRAFWEDHSIDFLLSQRVISIDIEAHTVTTARGDTIGYGQLIWATGGEPRRLSCAGAELNGVHTLRNRADTDRLLSQAQETQTVVIVGGGFIGLEAAAALVKLGKKAVLLEAMDRVLARVAGPAISTFYEQQHRSHGVDLRTDCSIERIEGRDRVDGVRLADGTMIHAQMVIVGIGIVPAVEPLLRAGAVGGNGVEVDRQCRTSLPDVFAIGDCALHDNPFGPGGAMRVESVQNAQDQATLVARVIAGADAEYNAVPWFWSNQYDLRLQTVGISAGHDNAILRGAPESGSFSVAYLKNGRVIAIDCVNMPRDYAHGRKLVAERTFVDPVKLADTSISLKVLACPDSQAHH